MSATLTWQNSGLGTKTGTTTATLITDLVALFATKLADSAFSWQVASSTTASSPNYIVLKRKDGSAGRILLLLWTAVAAVHTTILETAPTQNAIYGAYFPAGNVDTPSNLTLTSGTIMGDDTGAIKVWSGLAVTSMYTTSFQPYYFENSEAILFGFQNPGATGGYLMGAGNLVVDAADTTYAAVWSLGANLTSTFGGASSPFGYRTPAPQAGAALGTSMCLRTNYGSANRTYFAGWAPTGWGDLALGSGDILTDTSMAKAYFLPVQLIGSTKGEGFVLKLRQIAYGPGSVGAFTLYNTTGPTAAARQFNAYTVASSGHPWVTNFKI